MSEEENKAQVPEEEQQQQNTDPQQESQQNENGSNEQQENNNEQPQQNEEEFEEIEEEVPLTEEELAEAKKQAESEGKNPDEVLTTKKVIKKVKKEDKEQEEKQLSKQSSQQQNLEQTSQKLDPNVAVAWLKDVLDDGNVFDEKYWNQDFKKICIQFLTDASLIRLFFWVTEQGMQYSFTEPPIISEQAYDTDFQYFVKMLPQEEIHDNNLNVAIGTNTVKPNYIQTLIKMLDDHYNPKIYSDNTWPENVKKEFIAQMYKLMATFTEASQEGYTKLYIPKEDLSDKTAVSQDKDKVQTLEVLLITWYRQIKEVLSSQDNQTDSENAGPLDEINYWRRRKENLSYIKSQLEIYELQNILSILKMTDSSYVSNFIQLTEKINDSTEESQNNLDYLQSLYAPCKSLESALPRNIPELLPQLLNRVRMIWEHSKHYNSPERVSGLLHKISNEIIKRCKSIINIYDMLDGNVEKCIQDLRDSIACGKKWKEIYEKTQSLIDKKARQSKGEGVEKRKWTFSNNSIFAQIDAFVQRCTELTEICEGQLQFAGKGTNSKIPSFGGSRGTEIESILEEIKESFRKHLDKIRGTDKEKILDVKDSSWHDMFNSFKTGLKDLDVMYQNIINFAFEQVSTIQAGCEMLEAFDYLAKRESIKSAVNKKAQEIVMLFQSELQQAKIEFDNIKKDKYYLLNIPLQHGKNSGQAIWVRALIERIQKMKENIEQLYFVPDSVKQPAFEIYEQHYSEFKTFITTTKMKDWKESKDVKELEQAASQTPSTLGQKLDKPVLHRPPIQEEGESKDILLLESNFDKSIDKLIVECVAWKKLTHIGVVIPNQFDEFTTNHKENLRVLKEYVMLVVRDQNKIIRYMDKLEQQFYENPKNMHKNSQKMVFKLFKGHLEQINKVIQHGLHKLKWSSKGILETFVRDCKRVMTDLYNVLLMFKGNTEKIEQKCNEISQKIFVKNDKKQSTELHVYEENQEKHRNDVQNKLKQLLEDIKKILLESYEPFTSYGKDVQIIWFEYIKVRDAKIEESIKKAMKNSLLDLHSVIGDDQSKINPIPVFKVFLELSTGDTKEIQYQPSTSAVKQKIQETISLMSNIFKDFKKMEVLIYEEREQRIQEIKIMKEKETKQNPSAPQNRQRGDQQMNIDKPASYGTIDQYYQTNIINDKDIKKYTNQIPENLDNNLKELGNHLNTHNFKGYQLYFQPSSKQEFHQIFLDKEKDVSEIKSMIEYFENQQMEILKYKTTEDKGCIIIDNTNIKKKLGEILVDNQMKFLRNIQKKALDDLESLFQYFSYNKIILQPTPLDIHQLDKNRRTLKSCQDDKEVNRAKLKPIQEKFKLLEEYQQQFTEEQIQKKNRMEEEFDEFIATLETTEVRNSQVFQSLQSDTMKGLEEFQKEVSDNKVQFEANAPKQVGNLSNDKAFEMLREFGSNVQILRKKEKEMDFGFKLFNITYDGSTELGDVEQEITKLEEVWKVKQEWDQYWDKTKQVKFTDFDMDRLEEDADDILDQFKNYSKEVKKWEVVNFLKNDIGQFKSTLPLIKMLKEPYMRPRHWVQLQKNFGSVLEYESEDFVLNDIFKVNIISQADNVREVCETAREQYKIEFALQTIEAKWQNLDLILVEHKKGCYKISKIDEIQTTLEDNMGVLSAQKTTLFYDHFRDEIEKWEQTLQNISETLEQLLVVQRQWIYLEAIFNNQQGQDNDQKKQLMGDIAKFEKIEKQFQGYMEDMYKNRNAREQLDKEGFLKILNEMSAKLDESKKILFALLEKNRKEFPRFYMLSNDDLFEILGNSKDPDRINKHMLKCFQGVKKLGFISTQTMIGGGKKPQENYEVVSLHAPDGEDVKLTNKVACEYGVEKWLKQVEARMKESLAKQLVETHKNIKKKNEAHGFKWVSDWITRNPGQLLIVATQINWTRDCSEVLRNLEDKPVSSVTKAWKHVREDKKEFLTELTKQVRRPGSDVDREKLVALITIEVHAQDIILDLQKQAIPSPNHFEWQKQLRFECTLVEGQYDVNILQTNTNTAYGYEYQGNNGRLVVTSLTDRCYMTLTTAMKLHKGGAPQGPAGTGKTESVKDLGKGMGKFVLVFNCQEGLDYKSIGRLFAGLIQTGGWGCFDEFNRISVEVLSVVAEQMRQIMDALRIIADDPDKFSQVFEESVIPFNKNTGIFITMNPGYAGRSELPDNLKSLFRPMAMMVPDSQLIVQIMLRSEGFKYGDKLCIKVDTLYKLMVQQLSKQDHYEFGLRSIKSVLNCAGKIRREKGQEISQGKEKEKDKEADMEEETQETMILMRALRDMNIPKFIEQDIYLFNALFADLFPNIELQDTQNQQFVDTIEQELKDQGLIIKPEIVTKIIQLFDSKNTRHGNMLVGQALSGKSTCWKTLQRTLNTLNKKEPKRYPEGVKLEILNPKSVSLDELFGWVDLKTNDWNEGVLSTMMARLCNDESNDQKWMILDGPVDTLWIESMNTVLDDNKVLTLLNGDRIQLNQKTGLVFEVEDLSVASPATVSRAGMVYLDPSDIGINTYLEGWVNRNKDEWYQEFWYEMIEKWIDKMFKCRAISPDLVKCSDINIVQSLTRMIDSFMQSEKSYIGYDVKEKNEIYRSLLEKWFVFSLIWSFGGSVNEHGRKMIDYHMRDIDSMFPHANTVYDYFINNEKNEWQQWEDKINASVWKPNQNQPFHKMLVPTVDSARNRFLIQILIKTKVNTLIVGGTGTGKTAVINGVLQDLDDSYTYQNIVFSAQSNSQKTQEMIESKLVPRTKQKMIADGKKMVIFIDDLNMPKKDGFGSQPALELIRQWIDYEGWFDRTNRDIFKQILDIQLVSAMGPPGGGRAQISGRIQSKFNMINFTFPSDGQVKRIFQSILTFKFAEFDEEIKPLAENISVATLALFKSVSESFLPTPQKSHYVFNMRDISKVIQGVYLINKFYCDDKKTIFRIWVHECLRVFHDRLIDNDDRIEIKKLISDQLEANLQTNMKDCTNDDEEDTIFVDFIEESSGQQIYSEVDYKDRARMTQIVQDSLGEYNNQGKNPMNIVLFEDAISYVCKIHRIIKLGKGHGMLVGEGGSGRHSLTKLAAFIAEYNLFEISITKNYGMREFREDIKGWCKPCGFKNKPGVFLFSDNQIVNEGFIEDINNILTVGEVPNLFSQKEDYPVIRDSTKREYIKHHELPKDARISDEDIIDFFFTRVQANFHLMLCMSKTGDNLRKYCRMYPGLVNNTTIIWYLPWPEQALLEVSNHYLTPMKLLQKVEIVLPKEEEENKKEEEEGQEEDEFEDEEEKTEEELKKEEEAREKAQKEAEEAEEEQDKGFSEEELRDLISQFFSFTHTKVTDLSDEMWRELQRQFFITPSLYIELVKSYTKLLVQKQEEYGYEIKKLALGLHKLFQANENSKNLENQLQINDIQLKKQTKSTETLMVKIESEQRDAGVKKTQLEQRKAVVYKEQATIQELKAEADAELNAAKPALESANEALEKLDNKAISEIKSFNNPPPGIGEVLQAVMIIKGKETSWASAKKEMASPDFLKELKNPELKNQLSQKVLLRVEKLTHSPSMNLASIKAKSEAGGSLWAWVLAIEQYAKAKKDIDPKIMSVNKLSEKLMKQEEDLKNLEDGYNVLQQKIKESDQQLSENKLKMEQYGEEAKLLKEKKDRAEKLLDGLQGTQKGWKERKEQMELEYDYLIGNCLITAALMSYCGPFPAEKRTVLQKQLVQKVRALKISYSKDYSFSGFLAKPIEFLNWNFKGLPDDTFSKENAVLVMKGERFPLLIDPQLQGNKWVKATEKELREKEKNKIKILDPQTPNYMDTLTQAISFGQVVIFQNLDENIDPSIEPILNKSLKSVAGKTQIILGDNAIKYDHNFRFYMTTKLSNPKYKAEISTRVTLVNFTVKEEGLRDQLTSVVISKMEAQLEKSKIELVKKKADNEEKLKELDEKILKQLQESKGNLIDDIELIDSLQTSKATEAEVQQQIETGAKQMKKTLDMRNNYVGLAEVAAKLFFVINAFSLIDNMYQFSLESYIHLFSQTIMNYLTKNPNLNDSLQQKLQSIQNQLKYDVYKYACRGLFEKDKLLLSIQMAVKLAEDFDIDEWNFFLRGNDTIVDRKQQPPNPHTDWISNPSWDTICDLDKHEKLTSFAGLCGAFTHNTKEWKRWYSNPQPESEPLPGEWDTKCDCLKKMILIKTVRPDRVRFSAQIFVQQKLGEDFMKSPGFEFDDFYKTSSKTIPLIFILSPGTDPYQMLSQQSQEKGIPLVQISLGQGQEKKAKQKILEGGKSGVWLFLANCHLSLEFLKDLEKIIEANESSKSEINENFRLWLSSAPHPQFPISILQKCIKQTWEPPRGVKNNMLKLYNQLPPDHFSTTNIAIQNPTIMGYYKKALFGLTWFHAIVIERKRFKNLGWNVLYDFNDSDWETADNILQMYIDKEAENKKDDKQQNQLMQMGQAEQTEPVKSPPWEAIRYLISEVTYGGRVTDDRDRRLLNVYAKDMFNNNVIMNDKHQLGEGDAKYHVPDNQNEKSIKQAQQNQISIPKYYCKHIAEFASEEKPEVFGQHLNAEISSQQIMSTELINSIISLSPQTGGTQGKSREEVVQQTIKELQEQLPPMFNMDEIGSRVDVKDTTNPLKVVLVQEISRYNILLKKLYASLSDLDRGIQGLVLISEELEKIMESVYNGFVPESWQFCYSSLKPLFNWMKDLGERCKQLNDWVFTGQPHVFWLSGFSFPTGFTTALIQQSARKFRYPVDCFMWEYVFCPYDTHLSQPPKEGAYISGLFLEGAKWDAEKTYIVEPEPMKLYCAMPVIHFKPVYYEGKAKKQKIQQYTCPTYYYPIRTGTRERPSYMFPVQLPIKHNPSLEAGQSDTDIWVKKGTALLLSLAE